MSQFLSLSIAGVISGALYSLLAAGLVVSYSATGIFNLGYGAVAFTCAFLYYELHSGLGWPIIPAFVVTIGVVAPLMGLAFDRIVFRRLAHAGEAAKVMATVGILIALPAFAKWLVDILVSTAKVDIPTGDQVYLAPGIGPSPPSNFHLGGGVNLTSDQVIVFGVATLVAFALWVLMRRTSVGLHMRAAVDRPGLAEMRGIDRGHTSSVAWIIGTVLAGLAGVIGAPIFNSLDPNTYTVIMFAAIAAAVIGKLQSVPLAFAGGLALGVIENLVSGYVTFAQSIQGFSSAVPFVVLLIGLFLLGRGRERKAGTLIDHVAVPSDTSSSRSRLGRAFPMIVGLGAILVFVELLASKYYVLLTTEGLALGLVFLSYTLLTGFGGLVSLAQAAFVSGAGLMGGLLMDRVGLPWLLALVCGTALAAVLGCVVAVPAIQLGGLSFALASLALGLLGDQVLFSWGTLDNGSNGWTIAAPWWLSRLKVVALVLVVLLGLGAMSVRRFRNSSTGRAIVAVRASEPGAASAGVNVPAIKLWVFAISAGIAGFGGFLLVTVQGSATGAAFTTPIGLTWLASVVVWGIRRSGAAIIAGLSAVILPGFLISGVHWWSWMPSWLSWDGTKNVWIPEMLFGLGAVQMARSPDGILSLIPFGRRRMRGADRAETPPNSTDQTVAPALATGGPIPRAASSMRKGNRGSAQITAHPPGGSGRAILELDRVCAGYGDVGVLRDVSLALLPGTITALVGPNGAGKSTLAGVLAGTVAVSDGSVEFCGQDLTPVPVYRRARNGILVSPEARGIFPGLSVEENLAVRLRRTSAREQAYSHFPALATRRKLPAGTLSGGEQQMLALSSILVDPPAVLVADEPTLGLAPLVVQQVLSIMRQLRDEGVAVLLIEEKARVVMEIADHVAFLELGRLVWQGSRHDVNQDRLALAFLGNQAPPAAAMTVEHP